MFRSEGCEDGGLRRGLCWAGPSTYRTDFGLMDMKMNSYIEGCLRQNTSLSTQQTDSDLRAVKTCCNTENRVGHKKDFWEVTDGSVEGCNQEGTSARSRQTLF